MDWSNEQKLCVVHHYRCNIILWDTFYINHINKRKYSGTVDLNEMIMKDLHKSFYFKNQLAKELSCLS
jgi:hypothetical protein